MILSGRRVVLGVSGGIAAYKTCTLARRLTQAGAQVDVVLTASGAEFVRPVTFEALTGRPVLTSLWDRDRALDHIRLAQNPDLIVVAPATAHVIARAAQGLADDVLTSILLASDVPVLIAPAMNDRMFDHPATRENLDLLRERGWHTVGPVVGDLAEGPSDAPGRMSEPEEIHVEAERLLLRNEKLAGKRVVVTAGPTREAVDPVRVMTNRSSGLMGYELARIAYSMGADVRLITGPGTAQIPIGPEVIPIDSTDDLAAAVAREVSEADVLIMAAAPADYAPVEYSASKMKRESGRVSLELQGTVDVLKSTIEKRKAGCFCVGFALETEEGTDRARQKLKDKVLDLVVHNRADQDGAGMESPDNEITLIFEGGEKALPRTSKAEAARAILRAVESSL